MASAGPGPSEVTPRALRAARRAATRTNPATPTPSVQYPRQPLQCSNQPSQPLPPLLTQPNFGDPPAFTTLSNTSGLHLPDDGFFSSPEVAIQQETEEPDEHEAFFQSIPKDAIDIPSDFDFDDHSSSGGFNDDLDIFGNRRADLSLERGQPDQTAPPPNTPLPGVIGLPAPYSLPPGPSTSTSAPSADVLHVDVATPAPPDFDVNLANQPAEDEETGAQCHDTLDGDTEDEDNYDSPRRQRPGRISKEVHEIIEEFKGKMDTMVAEYASKSGRTESNLVSLWGTGCGYTRVHRSSWNKYQAYFARNRVTERARIKTDDADCNDCFLGFKAHYGKKWKAVLDLHDEMIMVSRTNQNEASRATTFDKFVKEMSRTAQKAHIFGFESVTFFVGSKMHHDQGLGEFIESPGAQGFWNSLPMTSDSVINFFQNHTFDAVRQTAQDDCARALQSSHPQFFNTGYQFANTSTPQAPKKPKPKPTAIPFGFAPPSAIPPSRPTKRNVSPSAASTTSSVTGKKGGVKDEDIVRAYLYEELELQGRSFPVSQMPWSKLKNQIAGQGFVLEGWPEEAAFPVIHDPTAPVVVEVPSKGKQPQIKKPPPPPPELSDNSTKAKGKKGQSGMRQIGVAGTRALAAACVARTLRVVRYKGPKTDLLDSRVAWITGVRPTDPRLGRRQSLFDGRCYRLQVQEPAPPTPSSSSQATPLASNSGVEDTPKPSTSTTSFKAAPAPSAAATPAPAPTATPAPSSAATPAPVAAATPVPASAPAPAPPLSFAPAPAPPSSFTPAPAPSPSSAAGSPLSTTPSLQAQRAAAQRQRAAAQHAAAPAAQHHTSAPAAAPQHHASAPAAAPQHPSAPGPAAHHRSAPLPAPHPSVLPPAPLPSAPTPAPAPATQQSDNSASGSVAKPKPRPTGKAKEPGLKSFSHPSCNPHPIYRRAQDTFGETTSTQTYPDGEASTGSSSMDPGQPTSVPSPSLTPQTLFAPNPSQPAINSPPPAPSNPIHPPAESTGVVATSTPSVPVVTIKRPADNDVDDTETKKLRGTTPALAIGPNPVPTHQVPQMRQVSPIPQMQMSPMAQMQMSPMQMQMTSMPGMHHPMAQGLHPMYSGMSAQMPTVFPNHAPSDSTPAPSMMPEGGFQFPYGYYGSPYTFYPPMPGYQPYPSPSPHPSMPAPPHHPPAPFPAPHDPAPPSNQP